MLIDDAYFYRYNSGGTHTMPGVLSKHAELSAEVEAGFEGGGGVAKKTQEDRARTMKMFKAYVFSEVNATVADLFKKEGKSKEQIEKDLGDISKAFSKYFWTLRVDVMVGNSKLWYRDGTINIAGKARGWDGEEGSEETNGKLC